MVVLATQADAPEATAWQQRKAPNSVQKGPTARISSPEPRWGQIWGPLSLVGSSFSASLIIVQTEPGKAPVKGVRRPRI